MENDTAFTPAAPVFPFGDFDQPNFFTTVFPEIVNVRSIVPFIVAAAPSVPFAANVSTTDPGADALAPVLLFTLIPPLFGRAPTVQVHAACVMPMYPQNGIVTSTAAATRPAVVQAMDWDSLPSTTESPPGPAGPVCPGDPVSPLTPS